MSEAANIADTIQRLVPRVAAGSLRFWGVWFGAPFENEHHPVEAAHDGELLTVRFDLNELLSVWAPGDWAITEDTFKIVQASRVRWEWFHYGRPQVPENFHHLDFARSPRGIRLTTNWPPLQASARTVDPRAPAVKIYRGDPLARTRPLP